MQEKTSCVDLISVIIPVYNTGAYLLECIRSIIEQTYSNLEIIIVDDGSTDGSSEICDTIALSDERITVIHKVNGGLSDARNAGLDNASGKYVSFIDSDDFVSSTFIEDLYKGLVNSNTNICAGGYIAFFRNKSFVQPERPGCYKPEEALASLIKNVDLHDHVTTKLFLRSLWDGIRFPTGKVFEDIRTTYRVVLESNGVYVTDKCGYWYRQRGNGIARGKFNANKLQMIDAIEELSNNIVIQSNPRLLELVNDRLLYVKCIIIRDVLIKATNADYDAYEPLIEKFFCIMKSNSRKVISDKTIPASIRVIAQLSRIGFGLKQIRLFFSMPIVQKYYSDQYTFFD